MPSQIEFILGKADPDRSDIIYLLRCSDEEVPLLFRKAAEVRNRYLGNNVYLRGLIEYSNTCGRNCLYCSIRRDNHPIRRYTMTNEEVIEAAMLAYRLRLGSIAIQAGEDRSKRFIDNITFLVQAIREKTRNELGITLSLGEQEPEVYEKWYQAGASRYLLRIEASSPDLYRKVHPNADMTEYEERMDCLRTIQQIGYQTGTGIMVGLPCQTLGHLADDIIFMRDFDVDMCGLGPFIEHSGLSGNSDENYNLFLKERFRLTLRMMAILRIVMKDINIIATTAMQAVDPAGRERAISCGANVIMPNLTPSHYRDIKPGRGSSDLAPGVGDTDITGLRNEMIPETVIGLGSLGDTPHYIRRIYRS